MTYHFENPSDETIRDYLTSSRVIAVVGLSGREDTASYQVSRFMQQAGYIIIPVNPRLAGQELLGQGVYASLSEIPVPVDMVNAFRPSQVLPQVAEDFIQSSAKIFWAQLGLESQEAEKQLRQAGKEAIVMNKCLKVEYQRLLGNML